MAKKSIQMTAKQISDEIPPGAKYVDSLYGIMDSFGQWLEQDTRPYLYEGTYRYCAGGIAVHEPDPDAQFTVVFRDFDAERAKIEQDEKLMNELVAKYG